MSGGKKRQADESFYIFFISPNSKELYNKRRKGSHKPQTSWCTHNKKINITLFVSSIHGERVYERNHTNSGDPLQKTTYPLGALNKIKLVIAWRFLGF